MTAEVTLRCTYSARVTVNESVSAWPPSPAAGRSTESSTVVPAVPSSLFTASPYVRRITSRPSMASTTSPACSPAFSAAEPGRTSTISMLPSSSCTVLTPTPTFRPVRPARYS